MKIIDVLNDKKLSLSFEVFPPKMETNFESVKTATEEIAALHPAFMSVTYGAGGGTSKYTLEIAKNIRDKYDVPTLAHLTCVSSSRDTVRERISDMKSFGIENVMALRGDLTPELEGADRSSWDYQHAIELVRELKEEGGFCIGAACYPEMHPESKSQREDLRYIKEKVDAGADFLTTQMVFDNSLFYNFMYKIRDLGVTVPIVPGIMPITNANQVERALKLSGSFMPLRFKSLVDSFGDKPEAMKQAGLAYAINQIVGLYANGITNVHVYSMNKPDVAKIIMDNLSDIVGQSNVGFRWIGEDN